MKIIKNKFRSWCRGCGKIISIEECPLKVKHGKLSFHLLCFYSWLKSRIERMEATLSDLRKFQKQLKKHNTQLLLETLGNDNQ